MLKPFLVIVHDFPKYLSAYTNTKLFASKVVASPKIKTRIKPGTAKSYIGAINMSALAKIYVKAKTHVKFALNASGKTKMTNKGLINNKLFSFTGAILKTNIKTRGTWKTNVGKHKAYLDPNRYYIGVPYLLGYWDGPTDNILLEEIDGLTVQEMSVKEN